jgi:hypothetical protein
MRMHARALFEFELLRMLELELARGCSASARIEVKFMIIRV